MLDQMKNSSRRGVLHPDDIKVFGVGGSLGPKSAPLPGLNRLPLRPPLSPLFPVGSPTFSPQQAPRGSHSRSSSVTVLTGGSSESVGRSESKRVQNQTEFGKYTEDDDDNYEDVFVKPNGTGVYFDFRG
jgi:hypothetical protein